MNNNYVIMDYEKKYEEALERAKKWRNAPNVDKIPTFANRVIEEIFPELCESEDERISKKIKKVLNWYRKSFSEKSLQNEEYDEMFAWLEKQGEQKPIDKIQLGKKYKCIASPKYSTFRRGEIYKPEDNFLCNLMNLCYECFEPIEDSEQKPIDKVEPKFKVKYAGNEYNVFDIKASMGIIWYGIEDEPNHIDYIKADSCEIISGISGCSKPTDNDMVEALRTEYEKGRADAIAEMQVAWSEEDDEHYEACLNYFDTVKPYTVYYKDYIWLKSLKERIGGKL